MGKELSYRMLSDDEKAAYAQIFKVPEVPKDKYRHEFERAHDKVWDHQQFLGFNWETFIKTLGVGSLYYYSKYMRLALPAIVEQRLRKNRHQAMVEFFNKMFKKYGCERVDKLSFPNGDEIDIDRAPSMKDLL